MVSGQRTLRRLLRDHRLRSALTLEGLAEASGVSDRTISDLERGASRAPQRRTLTSLVTALALAPDEAREVFELAGQARRTPEPKSGSLLEPVRVDDFTGRGPELDAALLAVARDENTGQAPLVVICGPAGVGKTTLVIEAMHRPQQVRRRLFVDLRGLSGNPLTPLQILRLLLEQVAPGDVPQARTMVAAVRLWRDAASREPTIVLLDNAETESQIRPVRVVGAQCALIVTARRSLSGLESVRRITLTSMSPADSLRLLERIVPEHVQDKDALEELATLCEGVPLALRIAGNRLAAQPQWRVADIVERLSADDARLNQLRAGDLAVGAALSVSYEQLTDRLRTLFRTLAVIPGGSFGHDLAAASIGGAQHSVRDDLDELADLGLLQSLRGNRFRFHDLVRLFAAEKLRDDSTTDEQSRAHRDLFGYLLATTCAAGAWFEPKKVSAGTESDAATRAPHAPSATQFRNADQARDWLRDESVNWLAALRAAANAGDDRTVVDVADSLHWFSDLWSRWGSWHEVFGLSAAAATRLGPREHAVHMGYLAWAQLVEIESFEQALASARVSVRAAQEAGSQGLEGWAWFYVSWAQWRLRDLDDALGAAVTARDLLATAGDTDGRVQATLAAAAVLDDLARLGDAAELHQQVFDIVDSADPPMSHHLAQFTRTEAGIGSAVRHLRLGNGAEALLWASKALEAAKSIQLHRGIGNARRLRGEALAMQGDPETALRELTRAADELDAAHELELARKARDYASTLRK
ncbi:NB-ARC domain-containing protein [Xylanimonas sp. McL0601]|uniref:NB-ARC domain-containing protein n=1 Tax=Xylanimonas sp. McL0601 TaxID=3414739 RepID=UPI003CF6EB19